MADKRLRLVRPNKLRESLPLGRVPHGAAETVSLRIRCSKTAHQMMNLCISTDTSSYEDVPALGVNRNKHFKASSKGALLIGNF